MKIKELHKDIERYLKYDCYCPNEIYSFDGFGYMLFYEDQECEKIGERIEDGETIIACIAKPGGEENSRAEIILFFVENEKCVDALRYDATENNLENTKKILANGKRSERFRFDEFEKGHTIETLKQILSICNAIIID